MRDTRKVASEVLSHLPAHLKGEIVQWSAEIDNAVYACMKEYAKEALTYLQENIHSYIDTGGGHDVATNMAFTEFKDNLL